MQIDIQNRPSFATATVTLSPGDTLTAESGSMITMDREIEVETAFNGTGSGAFGWLIAAFVGLVRKVLAGETMFVNHYQATAPNQEVMLAPAMVGDVVHVPLTSSAITVQSTSYLASTPGVGVRLVWGGLRMLFSSEGAFFLRCEGSGDLLVNSYGAIEKVELDGSYVVDSGHLVAWEGDLDYKLRGVGGIKSTLLSGEGLVMEFTGQGTLWLQTRNLGTLVSWVRPYLP